MYSISVKHGIIGAVILILVAVIQYLIGVDFLANTWMWLLSMFFVVVWLFVGVAKQRKGFSDFFSFKNAFLSGLIIYVLIRGITTIWGIVFFNVIDPDIKYELSEIIFENQIESMERWGAPQESIDEAFDNYDEFPDQFGPLGQLKSFLWLLLLGAFWSLIAALIFKRKPQLE